MKQNLSYEMRQNLSYEIKQNLNFGIKQNLTFKIKQNLTFEIKQNLKFRKRFHIPRESSLELDLCTSRLIISLKPYTCSRCQLVHLTI